MDFAVVFKLTFLIFGAADACFKAVIDTIPSIPKNVEDHFPEKCSDNVVTEFIKELFSILLVAPVSRLRVSGIEVSR